jgi:hypothetical protein
VPYTLIGSFDRRLGVLRLFADKDSIGDVICASRAEPPEPYAEISFKIPDQENAGELKKVTLSTDGMLEVRTWDDAGQALLNKVLERPEYKEAIAKMNLDASDVRSPDSPKCLTPR